MGSDLSIVLQTCVPSPEGLVDAFRTAGLVKGQDALQYVELRVMKADAALQFVADARTAAATSRRVGGGAGSNARNQVSLLVANCYSFVVGSASRRTANAEGGGGGNADKADDQAVYEQVRRAVRYEAMCRKRVGLVVDPSVQLGERLQEPQQGYRFARGTTYFLATLLTALEYDVPADEEIWTLSESPAPTLYLLDVRHNGLDDFSGPWLIKDVLERVRRVRHHALTVRRQELVHARIAQRNGGGGGSGTAAAAAAAAAAPQLPPPPHMVHFSDNNGDDSHPPATVTPGSHTGENLALARRGSSSFGTSDIMAAMDGYSDSKTGSESRTADKTQLAKKDLIFDVPIYMPNDRSDLFMGSLQCVLVSDNDLTLNGVDQMLNYLFETGAQETQRRAAAATAGSVAGKVSSNDRNSATKSQPNSHALVASSMSAGQAGNQIVIASDASALLLPYLLLIDFRRNAFDEAEAEILLHNKVGPLVEARRMTVLDSPGKPPPELTPLEKQRIALDKKKEEHHRQKEEAKRRKEEKKKKLEEEKKKMMEERKRVQREKAARQRQREEEEKRRREEEKRELLAAMDALRNPPPQADQSDEKVDEEEEEEDEEAALAAARAAPSDAGAWLDDEGGLMEGDVPEEAAAPPPQPADSDRRRASLSPRAPMPTQSPPPRDQQPAATPKKIKHVKALSIDQLDDDANAPPQLKDKDWSPQYQRCRGSRTPRQPLPTAASPRAAPPPQQSPTHVRVAATPSPSPVPPSLSQPLPSSPQARPRAAVPQAHAQDPPTAATTSSPEPQQAPHLAARRPVRRPPQATPPAQTQTQTQPSSEPSLPSRRSSRVDAPPPRTRPVAAKTTSARAEPSTTPALATAQPRRASPDDPAPPPQQQQQQQAKKKQKAPAPSSAQSASEAGQSERPAASSASAKKLAPPPASSPPSSRHVLPNTVGKTQQRLRQPVQPSAPTMHEEAEENVSTSSSSSLGDDVLRWADPYTGEVLDREYDYPALPDEAPDIVRARRSYSLGRKQTPRRLPPSASIFTPPPLPIAPPQSPPPPQRTYSSDAEPEMRHSARKTRWSEEPEEKRFNEGILAPEPPTPPPTTTPPERTPLSRRSTMHLPPLASSTSRRSSQVRHSPDRPEAYAPSDDTPRHDDEEEEEEPVIDLGQFEPAAPPTPFAAQKPRRKSSLHEPEEIQPSPMQSTTSAPKPQPPVHPERQSIRRDSTEERELRELVGEVEDAQDDDDDKDEVVAARQRTTQPPEEHSWEHDVYDEKNDPDVWGPPYKPPVYDTPKKRRKSSAKPGAADARSAPEDTETSNNNNKKLGAATGPAYDGENDPDVWGPPFRPQKRKPSGVRRPTSNAPSSARGAGHASEMNSSTGTRRASYVVPCSTSTSRMRAFYGQQARAQRERTASQDTRLRLAARPATNAYAPDVFRSPRKQNFVDRGPDEDEGLEVDQNGIPVDENDPLFDLPHMPSKNTKSAGEARSPSRFKRDDDAQQKRASQGRGGGHDDWNYRFPESPSRGHADKSEDERGGERQSSPSPKPFMADVLPRDDIVSTPSVSPSSQALDSVYQRHAARGGVLRGRPSVIRPGLAFEPPHPTIRTRSQNY